jgi:hypothetical protein
MIPHDVGTGELPSAKTLAEKGISDEMLSTVFIGDEESPGLQAENIALIIDACHSGETLESEEWRVGPMNSRSFAQLAWEKGMEIITASQHDQYAKELKSLSHGILTWCLLEGFEKAPSDDGYLYVKSWLDFAAREVPRISDSEKLRGLVPAGAFLKTLTVEKPQLQVQRPRVFHGLEAEKNWLILEPR